MIAPRKREAEAITAMVELGLADPSEWLPEHAETLAAAALVAAEWCRRSGYIVRTPKVAATPRPTDGIWSQADGYAAADARSGGRCEHPDGCTSTATVHHHIAGRGGANPHSPANLACLCVPCHRLVHQVPAESVANGMMASRLGQVRP